MTDQHREEVEEIKQRAQSAIETADAFVEVAFDDSVFSVNGIVLALLSKAGFQRTHCCYVSSALSRDTEQLAAVTRKAVDRLYAINNGEAGSKIWAAV